MNGLVVFLRRKMSLVAGFCCERRGRACLLCPGISDINLFRDGEGIVYLNAEVPDGAFDLGVAE